MSATKITVGFSGATNPTSSTTTTAVPVGATNTTSTSRTTAGSVGATNPTSSTTTTTAGGSAGAINYSMSTITTTGSNGLISATTSVPGNTTATALATSSIPVSILVDTVTTSDCGSKKLCVAEPNTCDPSAGNQCYFVSAKQQSGQLYDFELSGQSDGYIAAGLSTSSNQADSHQAYICANHNGAVRFFTGTLNNFVVNLASLDASTVKGKVSSGKIQCTFSATLPNTTTRAAGYSLSVSSGSYNPATGGFGNTSFRIQTPVVNLSDPSTTISNLINNTNSTSGAFPVVHQQSLMMPVLLLIVTSLAFTMQ
nr:putative ferric-chelate reductase 1 isoform X2 [Nothobranchius furzeri]